MKIAVPVFENRIAPRFDCARRFLLIEAADGGQVSTDERTFGGDCDPVRRVRSLIDWGADVLICGGIDRFSAEHLGADGVRVFSWVTGEPGDAIRCFLQGKLTSDAMLKAENPGGRWRFRRRGPRRSR